MEKDLKFFTPEQFEAAKAKGNITPAEVLAALASTDVNIETVERVCEALERNGIDIVSAELDNVNFDMTEDDIEPEELEEVTGDVDSPLPRKAFPSMTR